MKKLLTDSIISLSMTIVLGGCIEIGLRRIYPEISNANKMAQEARKNSAYRTDPNRLVALKPNVVKTYQRSRANGGGAIHWRTNSHAFRGDDLKDNSDFRIIVYGDSNVQGRFSELNKTFTYKLEHYLSNITQKTVEVLNAGVVGYGPDQSYIRFAEEADVYKPDLVVFHIFADNDFGDLIRNRLFEIDPTNKLIVTTHKRIREPLLYQSELQEYLASSLIIRGARKVFKKIQQAPIEIGMDKTGEELINLISIVEQQEYEVFNKSQPQLFSHFADHYDLDVATSSESESTNTKIKLMESILIKANELAASKDIDFLIIIQPSIVDLTMSSDFSYIDLIARYPNYKKNNLTSTLEQISVRNDIFNLNLFNVFLQHQPDDLYFRHNNNHWNDLGQDIAARALVEFMLDKDLSP